ncbi:MAG TPA: hypothetical protein VI504_01665 [Candidatus Eisenbacteria bacterium]
MVVTEGGTPVTRANDGGGADALLTAPPGPEPAGHTAPTVETIFLSGRPTLRRFLRFVTRNAVDSPDRGALADEWQAAREHLRALEITEAGLADDPGMAPLGPAYEPLLIELLRDPAVRHGFNTVPTDVALVELDRMVVFQHHIDLTFVRQLEEKLGAAPSRDEIFRTCLPYDHPVPPVEWSRVRRDRFVFVSPSNDLRYLGTIPLQSKHITGHAVRGALVGAVGLAVGFGSNFLNAVFAENRLILTNGSHRAYALRSLGVTHAPCIVQHASNRDELDLVASEVVRKDPDYYLRGPRPPLLRDYFDPRLRKRFQARRFLRQVTVRFDVDEVFIPAV